MLSVLLCYWVVVNTSTWPVKIPIVDFYRIDITCEDHRKLGELNGSQMRLCNKITAALTWRTILSSSDGLVHTGVTEYVQTLSRLYVHAFQLSVLDMKKIKGNITNGKAVEQTCLAIAMTRRTLSSAMLTRSARLARSRGKSLSIWISSDLWYATSSSFMASDSATVSATVCDETSPTLLLSPYCLTRKKTTKHALHDKSRKSNCHLFILKNLLFFSWKIRNKFFVYFYIANK